MDNITKSIILTPFNLLYKLSPKLTLRILFALKQGYIPDLDHPETFNEKLQWIKLYDHNPLMTKCVDKYTVRQYVKDRGCEEILNEIIWEGFDPYDIPFNSLPEKCVIKVTHGSTFNIICDDTEKLDKHEVINKCNKWLRATFIPCYGEWFYGKVRPRIIIEKYIESKEPLMDYKVFCFNGEPKLIRVDTDRFTDHKQVFYDCEWNRIDGVSMGFPVSDKDIERPDCLDQLLEYAKRLSEPFSHARVDFYITEKGITFGEITFTNGAGFDRIKPRSFDKELGSLIDTGSVIYIGWINKNKPADCGETMKNQVCIKRLQELGVNVRQMDFKNWKRHPQVFLSLAWNMLFHRKDPVIMSTSAVNIYPMLKLMKKIGWKQNVIHWVIGGRFGSKVIDGTFDPEIVGIASHTLVESYVMVKQLEQCGLKNVRQLPNFKPIDYYPEKKPHNKMRFVFLSRIMPEKGCDDILTAVKLLNANHLDFSVDFYGKIDKEYEKRFLEEISALDNVDYKGFLDLTEKEGYDILSGYDMMLFPTYWKGEGFAGIFIDAFIAGLPLIATDWAHNALFLKDNAIYVPVKDPAALAATMDDCIEGIYDIPAMSLRCQAEAEKYDVKNVITKDLLRELEII